jgi:hypothetical protein
MSGSGRLRRKSEEAHAHDDWTNLGLAGHDGLAREQLGKDAAGAPQVYGDAVLGCAEQELRRAVPERDDAAGHGLPLARVEEGGEPEVGDPEQAVVVDEEVGALDISVQDAPRVAVAQALEDLAHEALDLRLREALAGQRGEAGEVVLHVLEDEVEAVREARGDDALQPDHVGVVQPPEDVDLPRHEPHAVRVHVDEAHPLQRHDLTALQVPRLVHVAVRALPDLVQPLERVGAPGQPALDDLPGHGREPGGPPGDDVLAGEPLRHAGDHLLAAVRGRRGVAPADVHRDAPVVRGRPGGAVGLAEGRDDHDRRRGLLHGPFGRRGRADADTAVDLGVGFRPGGDGVLLLLGGERDELLQGLTRRLLQLRHGVAGRGGRRLHDALLGAEAAHRPEPAASALS